MFEGVKVLDLREEQVLRPEAGECLTCSENSKGLAGGRGELRSQWWRVCRA